MSLVISLDDGINIDDLLIKKLNKIVSIILEQEMVSECEINLRLMNDIEMQKLNMQFRQKNKTTNVASRSTEPSAARTSGKTDCKTRDAFPPGA